MVLGGNGGHPSRYQVYMHKQGRVEGIGMEVWGCLCARPGDKRAHATHTAGWDANQVSTEGRGCE